MLSEERVILMTHMASYETGEGKQNVKIGNYFRGDYIAVQLLKAVASTTVAFLVVFALYIFYHYEEFMQDLYKIDLITYAKNVLIYYGITVAVYGILTYVVSTYRYARAKRSLRLYYQNLKKLNSMYSQQ